jgi:hypothetical protein
MNFRICILAATLFAVPASAFAQSTTIEGARDGAATGGAVGGPLGAAVGGTVGATVGAAVEIPNAVIMSVRGANERSVIVEERVVVGEPLPRRVVLYSVPNHSEYRYAVVNDRRVIVEPRTRRVVRIVE